MEIRNPNKSHLSGLHALLQACLGPGWDPLMVEDRIFYEEAYDPNHVWMAREAGRILGFLLSTFHGDHAEIRLLAVAPDARRRGIGRDLLSRAEYRLSGEGARRVYIRSTPPRGFVDGLKPGSEAAAFFSACGYVQGDAVEALWLPPSTRPFEARPFDLDAAVAFAKANAGARWSWVEECLAHQPPKAVFDAAVGLALAEPGESLGPLWPAPAADGAAVQALVQRAWSLASTRPPRLPQGLRAYGLDGLGLPLQRETFYQYEHGLT